MKEDIAPVRTIDLLLGFDDDQQLSLDRSTKREIKTQQEQPKIYQSQQIQRGINASKDLHAKMPLMKSVQSEMK